MKKKLTRVLTFLLGLTLLIAASGTAVQAESYWNPITGTSDWVAMDGNDIDGTPTPAHAVIDDNGLTITYTGGEYTAGSTNSGVMYAKPVDLSNFSVEFTVTKRADYYNTLGTGCDSWISLCLLNKPDQYFNIKKAGQSQGIVTLIRPMETHTAFEVTQLMNNFYGNTLAAYEAPGDMKSTFKVEIKKGDDGVYDFIVNGVTADFPSYGGSDFSLAFTRLMEKGDVYFYMGVSSKDSSQQIEWCITKINGVAVKADQSSNPTEPTDPQPTDPQPTDPQPTDPQPTDPQPTDPQPTDPQPTDPQPTDPQPTDPVETDPTATDPVETDPVETNPVETDPVETDPTETDPIETNPVETNEPTETPTNNGATDTTEEPKSNAGPIIGIVAAVVLIGAVVFFVIKKKSR